MEKLLFYYKCELESSDDERVQSSFETCVNVARPLQRGLLKSLEHEGNSPNVELLFELVAWSHSP